MKILVLNGSPRKNGNTAAHVHAFQNGAEKAGHTVSVLSVGSMQIKGCIACEFCHGKGEGTCVMQDDMQKVIAGIREADMIVFASPIYYYGFTGQMQDLLSRFYSFYKPEKGKQYALFTSSIEKGAAEGVIKQYRLLLGFFEGEDTGIFTASDDEKTNQDGAFLKELEEFGASLKN